MTRSEANPSSKDAQDPPRSRSSAWFYIQRGETYGPVSATDLCAAAHLGFLGPDDMVRRADHKTWVPARRIQGLFTNHQ